MTCPGLYYQEGSIQGQAPTEPSKDFQGKFLLGSSKDNVSGIANLESHTKPDSK